LVLASKSFQHFIILLSKFTKSLICLANNVCLLYYNKWSFWEQFEGNQKKIYVNLNIWQSWKYLNSIKNKIIVLVLVINMYVYYSLKNYIRHAIWKNRDCWALMQAIELICPFCTTYVCTCVYLLGWFIQNSFFDFQGGYRKISLLKTQQNYMECSIWNQTFFFAILRLMVPDFLHYFLCYTLTIVMNNVVLEFVLIVLKLF
jgi:hypothetical protein